MRRFARRSPQRHRSGRAAATVWPAPPSTLVARSSAKAMRVPLAATTRPVSRTPMRLQRCEIDVRAVRPAGKLQRRLTHGRVRVGQIAGPLGEHAHPIHPPEDIAPTPVARHPRMSADGQRHIASAAAQLVGDLDAGSGGADDEHAALGKRSGRTVLRGMQVEHTRVDCAGNARDEGQIALTGGDDDRAGTPAAAARASRGRRRARADRHDLGPRHHRRGQAAA